MRKYSIEVKVKLKINAEEETSIDDIIDHLHCSVEGLDKTVQLESFEVSPVYSWKSFSDVN